MKEFIIKAALFSLLVSISILGTLLFLHGSANNITNTNTPLFIWGDSQAYQGLNLNILRTDLNRDVYTAARHGAGVYDFLIFSEKVPDSSLVLIAISKPVQLRSKEKDRNKSGLSFSALMAMSQNNYSFSEILHIAKKNKIPSKLFSIHSNLYSSSDSSTSPQSLSLLENIYRSVPEYLADKQNLYIHGILRLKNKGCKISFIEFPFHQKLDEIENGSELFAKTEAFKLQVARLFTDFRVETIHLAKNREIMYDYAHLNKHGASMLSHTLSLELLKNENTTLYIAH